MENFLLQKSITPKIVFMNMRLYLIPIYGIQSILLCKKSHTMNYIALDFLT